MRRFALVDILRGFSILLVILLHCQLRFSYNELAFFQEFKTLWLMLFRSGGSGVRIFFTISGFLITWSSLKRWGSLDSINLKEFFTNRFARIMPLLLLLLLVLSLLHFFSVEHYTINTKRFSYLETIFSALTFHLNYLEGMKGYLPASWDVLWSLSVEEVFYICFPILCLISKNKKYLISSLIFVIIYSPLYRFYMDGTDIWRSKAYFACMDSIAIGCLSGILFFNFKQSQFGKYLTLFGGLFLILFMLYVKSNESFWFLYRFKVDKTVLAIGVSAFLIASTQFKLSDFFLLLSWPLRIMGRLCYEIYLTHMFVIWIFYDFLKDKGLSFSMVLVKIIFITLVCTALAYFIEKFFSIPTNKRIRGT